MSKKTSWILAGLLFAGSAGASAQMQDQGPGEPPPDGPGGMQGGAERGPRRMPSVDEQLQRMTQDLKLTDKQKSQVRTILQDRQDQARQLMQDSSGSRDDRREKMRSLHETTSAKIRNVLTDDQKKKFEQQREQRMQQRRGDWGRPNPE